MEAANVIIFSTFTLIVASMIWARIYFFKVESEGARFVSYFNDPAVAIQMGGFYYCIFTLDSYWIDWKISELLFLVGIVMFFWAMRTAKQLDFANSSRFGGLVTNGPFAYVRHPCYSSYMLFWIGNSILFQMPIIWIATVVLILVYAYSAKQEEDQIMSGILAKEYEEYRNKVGMFWPKFG